MWLVDDDDNDGHMNQRSRDNEMELQSTDTNIGNTYLLYLDDEENSNIRTVAKLSCKQIRLLFSVRTRPENIMRVLAGKKPTEECSTGCRIILEIVID